MITVDKLIEHLTNMSKQGKGALPVYLQEEDGKGAFALDRGEVVKMIDKSFVVLVPKSFNIPLIGVPSGKPN